MTNARLEKLEAIAASHGWRFRVDTLVSGIKRAVIITDSWQAFSEAEKLFRTGKNQVVETKVNASPYCFEGIVYIMTREDHAYTTIYNAAAQAKVDVFWKLYKRLGDSDAADRQAIDLVTANFPALYNAEVNAGRNPEIVAWETREKIVAMT